MFKSAKVRPFLLSTWLTIGTEYVADNKAMGVAQGRYRDRDSLLPGREDYPHDEDSKHIDILGHPSQFDDSTILC